MKRFLPLLLLALPATVAAQRLQSGPQVLTFFSDVDDTEQPYAIYLPPDFDESRAWPLVVSLHGAGSNHRLNLRRVFGKSNAEDETDVEASRYFPEWQDRDYIVVAPFARGTVGYQGVAEKDVMDVLADVRRRFTIDPNRMYLTGLSMGGGGTFWIAATRPDLWAAIVAVCPAPPEETRTYAGNLLNVPVSVRQGGADMVVRPEGTRSIVQFLESLDVDVDYEEYPGVDHSSWVQAYEDGRVFDFFDAHVRDPYPDRVRFTTTRYAYDGAYWVRIDGLTPGTPASVDARFTADNTLEMTTDGIDGLTLELEGHPRLRIGSGLAMTVDGQQVTVPAAEIVSLHRTPDGWEAGRLRKPALAKGPGREGPLAAAVTERHMYVYGTAGDPGQAGLAERRETAEMAADWSVYRGWFMGRVMVFPRVRSDLEVRPSDIEEANLVLFGTAGTNRQIERLADRLPIHLTAADSTYGLVYVYPVGERYVVVSSGLPWWTPDPDARGPAYFFSASIRSMLLAGFEDFILFEGHPGNPVVSGRFANDWSLPAHAREALEASGVVRVQELH